MSHHSHHHAGSHARHSRRTFLSALLPCTVLAPRAFPQNTSDMAARFRRMSEEAERAGLAEPYKGITAGGNIVPGLFNIHSTGVSTEPVRTAAERFLASLPSTLRAKVIFPVDDPEWRKWM